MGIRRNKDIRVGDRVRVNKDVFRLPNPSDHDEAVKFRNRRARWSAFVAGLAPCTSYPLPPESQYQLYAEEGETGVVVQDFGNDSKHINPAYLPVLMDDGSKKTFRPTTLERL